MFTPAGSRSGGIDPATELARPPTSPRMLCTLRLSRSLAQRLLRRLFGGAGPSPGLLAGGGPEPPASTRNNSVESSARCVESVGYTGTGGSLRRSGRRTVNSFRFRRLSSEAHAATSRVHSRVSTPRPTVLCLRVRGRARPVWSRKPGSGRAADEGDAANHLWDGSDAGSDGSLPGSAFHAPAGASPDADPAEARPGRAAGVRPGDDEPLRLLLSSGLLPVPLRELLAAPGELRGPRASRVQPGSFGTMAHAVGPGVLTVAGGRGAVPF